jgi:indole-3-glycerol phosphate synthase
VQASSSWIPPVGALGRLCARARERANVLEVANSGIRLADGLPRKTIGFAAALRAGNQVAVIAEIKRRSPSKGVLNEHIGAAERAEQYRDGGARALSVLTEPTEFGGSNDDVSDARERTGLPVLKKDFHVAPVQVWEARALGASALLLIARALGPQDLRGLLLEARGAGIEALVEVRSEAELEWALENGAEVIGVNSRDLESLRVQEGVHDLLIPRIPAGCVAVAESGVAGWRDVERLARLGADAVLVGSALSVSQDPVAAVSALAAVGRRGRAA